MSPSDKRCGETRFLQFHHLDPYARGGSHDVDNLALRCRTHNQYEANRDCGRAFMERKRRGSGVREAPYQIAVTVCEGCERGWVEADGEAIELEPQSSPRDEFAGETGRFRSRG